MSVWLMLSRSPDRSRSSDEIGHALHEVLAAGGDVSRSTSGLVIGKLEGEKALGQLLQVELGALARALVEPLGLVEDVVEPARGDQVGLLPEIEVGIALPLRVLEAVVAGLGLGHGRRVCAQHALRGGAGQLQVVAHECALRLDEPCRVAHPDLRDLAEQLGRLGQLAGGAVGAGLAVRRVRGSRYSTLPPSSSAAACCGRTPPGRRCGRRPKSISAGTDFCVSGAFFCIARSNQRLPCGPMCHHKHNLLPRSQLRQKYLCKQCGAAGESASSAPVSDKTSGDADARRRSKQDDTVSDAATVGILPACCWAPAWAWAGAPRPCRLPQLPDFSKLPEKVLCKDEQKGKVNQMIEKSQSHEAEAAKQIEKGK